MRKNQAVRRKHKYFILLLLEVLGTWILSILIIQYCTSTQQTVKKPIPVSSFVRPKEVKHRVNTPWNLMLVNHENAVPNYYEPDLTT